MPLISQMQDEAPADPAVPEPGASPETQPATLPADPVPAAGGEAERGPWAEALEFLRGIIDPALWTTLLQRFLLVVLVIVAAMLLLRVTRRLLRDLQDRRNLPDTVMLPLRRMIRGTILIFAFILALQFAGFTMGAVWTTVGAILAVLGVGFIAVWSVLSNVSCSFFLMIFKPFRIGDHVEILDKPEGPNIGGRVTDVTLMYVVLREEATPGEGAAFIQVPNNLFFQRTIRRRAGKRTVAIEQHVEKHGLTGREQTPPEE